MISRRTIKKVIKAECKIFNYKDYTKIEYEKIFRKVNNFPTPKPKKEIISDKRLNNKEYYQKNKEKILEKRKIKRQKEIVLIQKAKTIEQSKPIGVCG